MNTPKIFQLLQSFDSADWRNADSYLKGKFRKENECLQLFLYLKKYKNNWDSSNMQPEKIKSRLFPAISEKSFTNVLSRLSLAIEDYFVVHSIMGDESNYRLTLLREYSNRGLYHQFNISANKFEHKLKNKDQLSLFDSLHLLKLDHLRFFSDNPIRNELGTSLLNQLVDRNRLFQEEYAILLEIVHLHMNEASIQDKKDIDTSLKESVLKNLLDKLLLFKKDKSEHLFQELYELIFENNFIISDDLRAIILELLIHDAHQQFKKGHIQVADKLLNLYEIGFDTGLLLSDKRISENKFINVISTACACRKYNRAENLINNYNQLLLEEIREGTIQLSKALIDFYQERYNDVIDKIRDYPFNSHGQRTRRRWMLICAYFKTMGDNIDFMYVQVKNYNHYFYNNKPKCSLAVYEGSLNLSKIITKILNGDSLSKVNSYVKSCEYLIFRTWVLKELGGN